MKPQCSQEDIDYWDGVFEEALKLMRELEPAILRRRTEAVEIALSWLAISDFMGASDSPADLIKRAEGFCRDLLDDVPDCLERGVPWSDEDLKHRSPVFCVAVSAPLK